jgi:probable rRNA maturation factor
MKPVSLKVPAGMRRHPANPRRPLAKQTREVAGVGGIMKRKNTQMANSVGGPALTVTLENRQRALPVTAETRLLLERVAQACGERELFPHPAQAHVQLVGNRRIRQLNKAHRGKDATTDVLSFPTLQYEGATPLLQPGDLDPASGRIFLGDIVICMPRMSEQAQAYGHTRARELAFLLAHGLLHLLGFDHETAVEAAHMFALQEAILSGLGLARGEERP